MNFSIFIFQLSMILLAAVSLSGCKTKEYIREVRTDTVQIVRIDTLRDVQVRVVRRDSVVHDSVYEVHNVEGEVVYKEVWRDRLVNVFRSDSLDKYRALCDSLRTAQRDVEIREVVTTRNVYKGWWAFSALLFAVAIYIYFRLRK